MTRATLVSVTLAEGCPLAALTCALAQPARHLGSPVPPAGGRTLLQRLHRVDLWQVVLTRSRARDRVRCVVLGQQLPQQGAITMSTLAVAFPARWVRRGLLGGLCGRSRDRICHTALSASPL